MSLYKVGQFLGAGAPESGNVSTILRVDKDNGDGTYDVTALTGAGASYTLEPHKHLARRNNGSNGGISVRVKYSGEVPEEFTRGEMQVSELISFMASQVRRGITS